MSEYKSPDLTMQVHTLCAQSAHDIFERALIGYWGRATELVMDVNPDGGKVIRSMTVTPHDNEAESKTVDGLGLLRAINEILGGHHVGSAVREQILRDVMEWHESPDYGPPMDAEACDYFVQIAAFREVVYG